MQRHARDSETFKLHRVLHYHLGPETEHTAHEAELIGITLALHLTQIEKTKTTPSQSEQTTRRHLKHSTQRPSMKNSPCNARRARKFSAIAIHQSRNGRHTGNLNGARKCARPEAKLLSPQHIWPQLIALRSLPHCLPAWTTPTPDTTLYLCYTTTA